jgi:hypothetical protein
MEADNKPIDAATIAALLEPTTTDGKLGPLIQALMRYVPLKLGGQILHKSRSELYAAERRGELMFIKDGSRTLITIQSILSYQAARLAQRGVAAEPASMATPEARRKRVITKRERQRRRRKA